MGQNGADRAICRPRTYLPSSEQGEDKGLLNVCLDLGDRTLRTVDAIADPHILVVERFEHFYMENAVCTACKEAGSAPVGHRAAELVQDTQGGLW